MIKTEVVAIIKDAIKMNASDIHFTLAEGGDVLTQLRVGNVMKPRTHIDRKRYEKILAYIRFNASMDLSNPMQPQSGGLVIGEGDDTLSCRISILPVAKFHSLVLRIINVITSKSLEEIPLFESNTQLLKQLATTEAGLILVGGPTSSGKSTTVYAMIDYLKNELGKSVITIEDPIEYQQPDIVQIPVNKNTEVEEPVKYQQPDIVQIPINESTKFEEPVEYKQPNVAPIQVNESVGMSYEPGIKEILRHDPDVIVIGEIRDKTTAQNAVRAALTGHLVISTIHSKDNLETIQHMTERFEISKSDMSQSLVGLVNQRLIPVDSNRKALFEIYYGETLKTIMEQVYNESVLSAALPTIDEEFLKWQKKEEKYFKIV